MFIKITKSDCSKIINGTLQVGGDNAELVKALAKKCLALADRLGKIHNERNEYFEAIYSATLKFEKVAKDNLDKKRNADHKKKDTEE